MKLDSTWNCKDCNVLTFTEYYMVQNKLWKEAVKEDTHILLCIDCLEKRIGRQLTPEDFTDCPLNQGVLGWDDHTKSPLLLKRLRHGRSAK